MLHFALLWILLFGFFKLQADDLLEIGAGVATLSYPDYIGSRSTQFVTIPHPYINYKSDKLEISKGGIRSKLFNLNDLEIDLSVGGSLPANSSDNAKREGMQDLDLIFEVGPKIIYTIYRFETSKFVFELPARLVYSTDLNSIDSHGYSISPELFFKDRWKRFSLSVGTAALYGSERYHDYFYQVDQKYATQTRKAYNAKAGFGGLRNKIVLGYGNKNWRIGFFLSHYYLHKATYRDSPLVESRGSTFAGSSLTYVFYTQKGINFSLF